MVESPRPTRAEATDVANAILDGTDAVMLSEETAVGAYPVEAVRILDRIARATEPYLFAKTTPLEETPEETLPATEAAISRAACMLAKDLDAAAIIAGTSTGSTARLVARFRPPNPIVGLTQHLSTQRQLTLSWGVLPVRVLPFADADEMFSRAREWMMEKGMARKGERLVLTAGVPVGVPGATNLLKVLEI
jgi:pyruvate kinase